jgi:hypothetical protein
LIDDRQCATLAVRLGQKPFRLRELSLENLDRLRALAGRFGGAARIFEIAGDTVTVCAKKLVGIAVAHWIL